MAMNLRGYCAVVLLAATVCSAQKPVLSYCSPDRKFCWSDNEINVVASGWATSNADDVTDGFVSPNAFSIRCMKDLRVCIQAESGKGSDIAAQDVVVNISVMPVKTWDNEKVTFSAEGDEANPCFRTSYTITREDSSVLLVISAERNLTRLCTVLMRNRKSITYRLNR